MPSLLTISSIFLATTSTTITCFYFFHRSLGKRVHHVTRHGDLPSSTADSITTIPPPIYKTSDYRCVYDHASRRVRRGCLPSRELPDLFTQLVRRNMSVFSRFPQAWMLRLVTPSEDQKTFQPEYIKSLDFNEGDVVCGVYPVLARAENKVELAIRSPKLPAVEGRLVIRYCEEGEDVLFCTETAMWTKKQGDATESGVMPLEIPLLRFMHQTAAWWLIDSGTTYLMHLGECFS